jgi:hypothetical protein
MSLSVTTSDAMMAFLELAHRKEFSHYFDGLIKDGQM